MTVCCLQNLNLSALAWQPMTHKSSSIHFTITLVNYRSAVTNVCVAIMKTYRCTCSVGFHNVLVNVRVIE